MRKTLRRYKLGYALAATFSLIGLSALLVVVWKSWEIISSSANPYSTFWVFLWTEELSPLQGLQLKPIFLMILAAATLVSSVVVYRFSRQWFFLPDRPMRLQCPFCKKRWKAGYDRGQVSCPHCHHLVHPRIIEA